MSSKNNKKSFLTINVNGVGPVTLQRSSRAKRVIIYVGPVEGVKVAVPWRVSYERAEEFVSLKKNWIEKHLDRLKRNEKKGQITQDRLETIDLAAARKTLIGRLEILSRKHGFKYNKVFVRNQKTRWGSCSHRNNISLNIKLVKLPNELLDYVILHELVHTRLHNHSIQFWEELDRYVKNAKAVSKRIRARNLELL